MVSSRGEQPPCASISLFIALVFARLLIGVGPRRRWATPPCSVPYGAPAPALCPRFSSPCRPERARVFPQAPRAPPWSSPRLMRDLAVRSSDTTIPKTGRRSLDLGRPPEIWPSRSNQNQSNVNRPMKIQPLRPAPLTYALSLGPTCQPYLGSLTPRAHLSALTAHLRARSSVGSDLGY
jgi:hypothetical protein